MNSTKQRAKKRRRERYERDRLRGQATPTASDMSRGWRVPCRGGYRIMREGMRASY